MPSLAFLESVIESKQAPRTRYLSDVYCGYSKGDSECKTCPTIPACPKRAETKGCRRV